MSKLKIKNGSTWEEIPAGGVGVPSGGTAGQVLMKSSATDYADEWADISEAGAMSKWALLWTNASPTSSFSPQTVSLDLGGYDAVLIYVANLTSRTCIDGWILLKGAPESKLVSFKTDYGLYPTSRNATVTATGVTFGDGYDNGVSTAANLNNNCCIPYSIYGIKGVQ